MAHTSVLQDLQVLRTGLARGSATLARLGPAGSAVVPAPAVLAEVGAASGIGLVRTLALVLKADAEAQRDLQARLAGGLAQAPWTPWERSAAWHDALKRFADRPAPEEFELLVIELALIGVDDLATTDSAELAQHHATMQRLLGAVRAAERARFVADKRAWLLQQHRLDVLIERERALRDEQLQIRLTFASTFADYAPMCQAARACAMWRYRRAFDDPTLTDAEVAARLANDLFADPPSAHAPPLERELRAALLDDPALLAHESAICRRLDQLAAAGRVEYAAPERVAEATRLLRRIRQRTHPDKLCHQAFYRDLPPQHRRRLAEIWDELNPSDERRRVTLELQPIDERIRRLERLNREIDSIVQHGVLPNPQLLISGETLEQCWTQIRSAALETEAMLHALRSSLARLMHDAVSADKRRLLALDDAQRDAEARRMRERARAWLHEAQTIEQQQAARHEARARAESARFGRPQ